MLKTSEWGSGQREGGRWLAALGPGLGWVGTGMGWNGRDDPAPDSGAPTCRSRESAAVAVAKICLVV